MTENQRKIVAMLFYSTILSSVIVCLFIFWLFPSGVEVLTGIDFVDVTPEFTHNLYWFFIGLFILVFIRSINIQM